MLGGQNPRHIYTGVIPLFAYYGFRRQKDSSIFPTHLGPRATPLEQDLAQKPTFKEAR